MRARIAELKSNTAASFSSPGRVQHTCGRAPAQGPPAVSGRGAEHVLWAAGPGRAAVEAVFARSARLNGDSVVVFMRSLAAISQEELVPVVLTDRPGWAISVARSVADRPFPQVTAGHWGLVQPRGPQTMPCHQASKARLPSSLCHSSHDHCLAWQPATSRVHQCASGRALASTFLNPVASCPGVLF